MTIIAATTDRPAARANKNRRAPTPLAMIPSDRRFHVANVAGLGGVVLVQFGDEIAVWHVSPALGRYENRVAYRAACDRALAKFAA